MSDKFIKTAVCLALFISLFACSSLTKTSQPTPAPVDIQKEEQAVYSYFVRGIHQPVLILEETSGNFSPEVSGNPGEYIKTGLKGVSSETLNSYIDRNSESSKLPQDMQLGTQYILLTIDELAKISSQPNWGQILTEKYPNSQGYIVLSHVGFNHSLDQAVVYMANVAGPLMGGGSYYLLEKFNGEWIVKEQMMAWIS